MTRKCLSVLSSFAVVLALNAQQAGPFSADEVVRLAITRNLEFLALRERVHEAEALLRQAGVRPYPTIETSAATGRPLGTPGEEEYSAGYFQPIETAGKWQKRISVAQLGLELAKTELQERQRQLSFEVQTWHLETVAAQQKLATIRSLLDIDRQNYELTNARVREGDAAPLEAALFLTEANRTRAQQTTYQGRLTSTLSELRRAVGLTVAEPFEIQYAFPAAITLASLEDLKQRARNRSDLRAARIVESQTGAEIELARAEGRPDFTASVRYVHRTSQFDAFGLTAAGSTVPLRNRDNILNFGLSIPLFTTNRNRGNVEAAGAREASARQKREFLENATAVEVDAAYVRLQAARETSQLLATGVIEQSENNVKVIREAYNLGQLRALDVLNEQRRLVDTRLSYVDAQLEEARALIELERAVGGPIQ